MSRVPAVRFKGFTDPWEQRKLGELTNIKTGESDLQDATPDGTYPFFVRSDKVERSNRYLFDGEAILVPGEGRLGEIFHYINGKFDYHQRVYKISDFANSNAKFVMYSMMHDFKRHALANTAKATVDSIRLPTLTEFRLRLPAEKEQRQIGTFFQKLDHLITLHQCKYDKLCTIKKSMLDKMFPKPGELVPEIRFEGFTDPWEQRKFSDFVQASGVRNSNNLDLQSYSVSNEKGFVPQNEQFENGGTMAEADKTAYWIVTPGSFAYNPARINVGSIGYLSTCEDVIVSSLYEVFKADETCDDRFLWHWFKSPLFLKQIEMYQEGGVRLYFFFDKLLKSEIWMPSVDEQQQISSAIDNIDRLITLQQRKLELLKNVKKSLLDKMFV